MTVDPKALAAWLVIALRSYYGKLDEDSVMVSRESSAEFLEIIHFGCGLLVVDDLL